MRNKLVSVIVPCYNNEKDIGDCIDSLKNQTYKNIELIVVDDHSSDNSVQVVKKLGVKLVINQENIGVGRSRNVGIKNSKGEIIVQTDADAFYPPDYIEKLIEPLNLGYDGSIAGKMLSYPSKSIVYPFWKYRRLASWGLKMKNMRERIGAWCFYRYVVNKIGYYDESLNLGTDVEYYYRMVKNNFRSKWIPDCVWYHKDPNSISKLFTRIRRHRTRQKFEEEINDFQIASEMLILSLKNKDIVGLFLIIGVGSLAWIFAKASRL